MVKKFKKDGLVKIEQSEHKIKVIGERYISTDFPSHNSFATEYVFDLKKYTIQTSVRTPNDEILQYTSICN